MRHRSPQPGLNRHPAGRGLLVAMVLAGWPVPGAAENTSCTRALGAPAVTADLKTLGTEPAAADFAVVPAPDRPLLAVRVTGKEHSNVAGTATVRVFDLAALQARPDCTAIVKTLAEADADYAAGEAIATGRSTPGTASGL